MKKNILFLLVLFSPALMAQTIVNVYDGMNLQDTINNSPDGTVYYIHPGEYIGNLTIDKKVTIIGKGFFLQDDGSTFINGNITLNRGAENSLISGIECKVLYAIADDLIIEKNKTNNFYVGNSGSANIVHNVIVRKNYIVGSIYIYGFNIDFYNNISTTGIGSINSDATGITVINNTFDSDIDSFYMSVLGGTRNVIFKNNILGGGISTTNINVSGLTEFTNNIYGDRYAGGFTNADATNLKVDRNSIFLGWPDNVSGSKPDARNLLAPDSPARKAGENGTDAGAFGGEDPFILGGVPDLPQIYHLRIQSPVSQDGTMHVELKAKTNN